MLLIVLRRFLISLLVAMCVSDAGLLATIIVDPIDLGIEVDGCTCGTLYVIYKFGRDSYRIPNMATTGSTAEPYIAFYASFRDLRIRKFVNLDLKRFLFDI